MSVSWLSTGWSLASSARLILLLSCVIVTQIWAADDDAPAKPDSASPAAKADPFAVPEDAKPEELLKFLEGLTKDRPRFRTQAEMLGHIRKLSQAQLAATAKLLAQPDLDPALALTAAKIRQSAVLNTAMMTNNFEEAQKQAAELVNDKRPAIASLGKNLRLRLRISQAERKEIEADELAALATDLLVNIKDQKASVDSLAMTSQVTRIIERKSSAAEAVKFLEQVVSLGKGSEDPESKELLEKLTGTIRRLKLPGNAMEVRGTTLDGQPFDVANWRGKVVLVDFWATWCGPCVAELPHVKKLYTALHDRGFEIVGISLDDDIESVQNFVKKRELPWPNLFSQAEGKNGWDAPLAVHYGVSSIPTCILINAEGKVVSLNARGKMLDEELTKIYGPLPELDKPAEDKPAEKTPAE